jgi:hypothetical protein
MDRAYLGVLALKSLNDWKRIDETNLSVMAPALVYKTQSRFVDSCT